MTDSSVDVCVCTFRRASIVETLRSISAQNLPRGLTVRVIVADNDEHDGRRNEIERLAANLALDLQYRHAPARNISVARNACLDAARSEWSAFLDDDEIADPEWLGQLMVAGKGRDIVFGVSRAVYADDAPRWIVERDLHSNRITGNDPAWNGYTANVLLRRRFIVAAELRFDPALGQSGGEDTIFFHSASRAGARFGYAPNAVVSEPIPTARTTLRWLLLRRFRSGQIHHLILRREKTSTVGVPLAIAKASWCLAAGTLSAFNRGRSAEHLLRGALHMGVVAAAAGLRPYREYAQPD